LFICFILIIDLEIYVRVQALIVDLPAKAAMLNVKQFNGEFGCISCFNSGESAGPGVRIYKGSDFDVKTTEIYNRLTKKAIQTGQVIFGVKGPSVFNSLIEIPVQVPFDYMHLCLQGHTRWLINELVTNSHSEIFLGLLKLKSNQI
jgi:hypothetical protein